MGSSAAIKKIPGIRIHVFCAPIPHRLPQSRARKRDIEVVEFFSGNQSRLPGSFLRCGKGRKTRRSLGRLAGRQAKSSNRSERDLNSVPETRTVRLELLKDRHSITRHSGISMRELSSSFKREFQSLQNRKKKFVAICNPLPAVSGRNSSIVNKLTILVSEVNHTLILSRFSERNERLIFGSVRLHHANLPCPNSPPTII